MRSIQEVDPYALKFYLILLDFITEKQNGLPK